VGGITLYGNSNKSLFELSREEEEEEGEKE